jgi:hypothetical protein
VDELTMKHHKHNVGWRVANRHDVPLWKEFLALASCYALTIGLVVMAVYVECRP